MRIIAGSCKGRRLLAPKDGQIRPTTDKVKEALFSILTSYLEDAVVLDLFSGTGSLGLEAISRGAKLAYFGDISRTSMALTKENISHCQVENQCVTILGDWTQVLKRIDQPLDLIFLDPPYKKGLMIDCIQKISDDSMLSRDGWIVAEHGTETELPDCIGQFERKANKKYGTIMISLYARLEE